MFLNKKQYKPAGEFPFSRQQRRCTGKQPQPRSAVASFKLKGCTVLYANQKCLPTDLAAAKRGALRHNLLCARGALRRRVRFHLHARLALLLDHLRKRNSERVRSRLDMGPRHLTSNDRRSIMNADIARHSSADRRAASAWLFDAYSYAAP